MKARFGALVASAVVVALVSSSTALARQKGGAQKQKPVPEDTVTAPPNTVSAPPTQAPAPTVVATPNSQSPPNAGIHKIQHVIIIMQENRSFDSYFGTFPGADGIPSGVCIPDPKGGCSRPYHDPDDRNRGGPHGAIASRTDVDGGKMDGFVAVATGQGMRCEDPDDPRCGGSDTSGTDVMGWHDAREIPNYWTYAEKFVLHDHMYEPNASWSLPQHLFMVSEWSAKCTGKNDPMSCVSALESPDGPPDFRKGQKVDASGEVVRPNYAWTDLTFLLHAAKVSWRYYVAEGTEPDCEDDEEVSCIPRKQRAGTPGIWNPLPWFSTVHQDGEIGNIQTLDHYLDDAKAGTLPSVAWIVPSNPESEHPPSLISDGQRYVTTLINAAMQGPEWDSTAIFLAWDDWGGFYDNEAPPTVDTLGYGMRVPSMVISPYAKAGYVDHQVLSFDAYAKFIEDDFLGGSRIDPATDGRPDSRPGVRENVAILGDLSRDFDFDQAPRPPVVLSTDPAPGPASVGGE